MTDGQALAAAEAVLELAARVLLPPDRLMWSGLVRQPELLQVFYWAAILLSNTLGTALGDFVADSSGLGFARSPASSASKP